MATFADLARYSGLNRDLRDQSMSMDRARSTLLDDELAATIAGLGKGGALDGPGAIAMAERTIGLAFKNMQKETALRLLKRLFNPPETANKSTMMGHDMFTEERLNYESDIKALKEVITDRNRKIGTMTHQLELLKLDKTFLQRHQRELQTVYEEQGRDFAVMKAEYGKLKADYDALDSSLHAQRRQVAFLTESRDKLLGDLEAEKLTAETLRGNLAAKRTKKRAYK